MTNKTYDILAYIQRIFLPALAALVLALGKIWGWESEALLISATIEAVDYFMGRTLKISSDAYFANLEQVASLDVPDQEEEEREEGIG